MTGGRFRWLGDPVARGFVLLSLAAGFVGFAMSVQQTVVANFFNDVLRLDGPQFGYITAIREVPGFLLIFLVALFYRLTLPHLTALALTLLTVGYAGFGTANSFWSVAPWVIISSFGYHVMLQTQHAMAMSLTVESRAGAFMGKIQSWLAVGNVAALIVTWAAFEFRWLDFSGAFILAAVFAFLAAIAVYFFPNLRDGKLVQSPPEREPIVFRREYGRYYLLRFLDGARMQVFFSFGLWVLVNRFHLEVQQISLMLIAGTALVAAATPYVGRLMDHFGERAGLSLTNFAYIIILGAYALSDNVYVVCACYITYQLLMTPAEIGCSMYIRKVAVYEEVAPSLAMGLSVAHAAAIVVPVATGFILNFVGYQVPFLIACGIASLTILVTRGLDANTQKSPRRLAIEASAGASD